MNESNRARRRAFFLMLAVTGSTILGATASTAWAQVPVPQVPIQQKHMISFQTHNEHTRYTEQHTIDLPDTPGHQIRMFEIHRTFPKDPPVFAGVPAKESMTRGQTDLVGSDGRVLGYVVYVLENGDKIFGKYEGTAQGAAGQLNGRRTMVGNTTLTGGTGKFHTIRGTLHATTVAEPLRNYNESKNEGVYWMEKE
ncbi:hypothetical protein CF70_001170 [Cupriavidus sp. SK-3]|uniref:hypothetical protein n=1 Tax=Cupriavidus sp. SK-3 TaxID=1470558 RepID=UPI00044A50A7|nr:hypothetical protein [Cupriavidus sp. SK-3]KDP87470.1 hypothetical protein CF70_001170 [Cupriavidus sp. SK-3]